MTALEAACNNLGWQGGTCHDARKALEDKEDRLIRMYNQMDEETDQEVSRGVLLEIAVVQHIQMHLLEPPESETHK